MCTRSVDRKYAVLIAIALAGFALPDRAHAQGYPSKFDFGTSASTQEVAAVAIAIAPDGKGLPAGKGDYATGKRVYETACSACHGANLQGVAGLRNMPAGAALRLIGGRGTLTTKNPVMTVESYWPYATTLFDYVRRAMPFQAPGSLTADEIYAVSAYILAEGNVIDKAVVLDAATLVRVQMPNRDGFIPDPGLNCSSSVRRDTAVPCWISLADPPTPNAPDRTPR
ncbi:MAG TPA: cytochrome c [Bradyrhizobium sp.]|nr:cytochrome c [Bradyrhizobium sp.]